MVVTPVGTYTIRVIFVFLTSRGAEKGKPEGRQSVEVL